MWRILPGEASVKGVMNHTPIGAGSIMGLAMWCTRGALDFTSSNGELVRVAMLPPGSHAFVFVTLGIVACGAWAAWRGHGGLLPLYASSLLILPYMPLLPDLVPALTVFAGPAKYVVWVLLFCLSAVAVVHEIAGPAPPAPGISVRALGATVFVVSLVVYGAAAYRLTGSPSFPGGDEPHYLVIAQSLWRDGDLRIENNHQRGDTYEYYASDLEPHFLARGTDGEIYSVHPVGLPFLLAPVYAFGGYRAVVWLLTLVAAAAAFVSWRLAFAVTRCITAATFGWFACMLSAPFVFNSFTVYPETCASLAVATTYYLAAHNSTTGQVTAWRWLVCGMLLATLPWLSTKYVLMAGMLGLVVLGRLCRPPGARAVSFPLASTLAVCVPPAISLLGWFAFFERIWGTPSPSAPYGSQSGTHISYLLRGGFGLFFDQEYGLLLAAPALGIGLLGLLAMSRAEGARRIAFELGGIAFGLLALVGSFHIWWGGSAAIGRPMIAALPLLSIPTAWRFRARRFEPGSCVAYISLALIGAAIAVILGTVGEGVLLVTERNGESPLLLWTSPAWDLSVLVPSFIISRPALALAQTLLWCAAFFLAAGLFSRVRRWGRAGLLVPLAGAMAFCAAASAVPVAFSGSLRPPHRLEARHEIPLLQEFSPSRRPIAIRYEPWTRLAPTEIPPSFRFVARPGDSRPEAPIPLLHNGRWSLAAGRYEIELVATPGIEPTGPARLGLQVGRLGEPIAEWPVTFDGRGRWSTSFVLPVTADSVGFRATPDLDAVQAAVVLTPLAIRDTRDTPPALEILQAGRLTDAVVFFHDDRTKAEPGGFWTQGAANTVVTVAPSERPLTRLRLRAGPVATSVRVAMWETTHSVDLKPHESRDIDLPVVTIDPWRVVFDTATSFVPIEIDPAVRDRRRLGCWVELLR